MRADEEMIGARLMRHARAWAAGAAAFAVLISGAAGQAPAKRDHGEVHGLKLGLAAQSMTLAGFGDLACGSNGGPPRQRIEAWTEFGKCRPEDNGLHEVYIRFDDEDD